MPVILPILLLGLGAGAADDSRAAEEHQDIQRIAPVRLGAGADVGHDTARDLLVRPVHENAFGVRRGEFSPTGRSPGLLQHGGALRRRLRQMDCVQPVMAAGMPHAMDLARVGKDAVRLVAQHRAIFPARLP